jgi:hypothetical protein
MRLAKFWPIGRWLQRRGSSSWAKAGEPGGDASPIQNAVQMTMARKIFSGVAKAIVPVGDVKPPYLQR